jgi:hypothetical protein
MSILEVTMLACFGVSWPLSIAKILRTKQVAGKSPAFLAIILVGYASGVAHKIIFSRDWVLSLYVLNLCMVALDMALYLHYSRTATTIQELPDVERESQPLTVALSEIPVAESQIRVPHITSGKWPTAHNTHAKHAEGNFNRIRKRRFRA